MENHNNSDDSSPPGVGVRKTFKDGLEYVFIILYTGIFIDTMLTAIMIWYGMTEINPVVKNLLQSSGIIQGSIIKCSLGWLFVSLMHKGYRRRPKDDIIRITIHVLSTFIALVILWNLFIVGSLLWKA